MKIFLIVVVLITLVFGGKYSPTVEQRVSALKSNILIHKNGNDENIDKMVICLDKVESKDDFSFCKYRWKKGNYSMTKARYLRMRANKVHLLTITPD